MATPYYRLRIKSLKFISAVDQGAQGPISNVALIKRAPGGDEIEAVCKVALASEKMGLVFGWALANTLDGGKTPHVDLQDDAIVGDDELIKVAAAFMEAGGASDVLHADVQDGTILFCLPLTGEVLKALHLQSDVHGLAIGMRPSPETFQRFLSGELNAFSIAGTGERELVKAAAPFCQGCGAKHEAADATKCATCGMATSVGSRKAVLSTADRDALPDSAFLYIEAGGKRDAKGKTEPRSLRHFPYKSGAGAIDLAHLRSACQEIPKSSLPADLRERLQVRAEKLLAAQHDKASKGLHKQAALTSAADGHQHQIDLDDPADGWRDQLATSYQTAEGATEGHSHAWTYDPRTGKVTIAQDSGHDHTVDAAVPPDVLRQAALNESGERCAGCGEMCEASARFCPSCGARMGSGERCDGIPTPVVDEPSSGKTSVIVVAARAPAGISTPAQPAPTVSGKSQENQPMDPKFAKMLAAAFALPEPHRLHVAKLAPEDQAAFLGMSPADQDSAIKAAEAADPEVYKTAAGISIRKSHGPLAEQMARQADTTAAELAKQAQQLAIEKAERARVTLEKRASDVIPLIGASLAERVAILKAVDGIAEEATRNGALDALKGANEAFRLLGVPRGAGGDAVPENKSPRKAWDDGLAEFAKSRSIANPLDAIVPFLKTEQGQTLRKALDAQRPLAQPS